MHDKPNACCVSSAIFCCDSVFLSLCLGLTSNTGFQGADLCQPHHIKTVVILAAAATVTLACSGAAKANPTGTVTVYNYAGLNGGPTSIEGSLRQTQCGGTGVSSCTNTYDILSASNRSLTVISSVSSNARYGILFANIAYQDQGDVENPNSFTPSCTLSVSVSSNGSMPPLWTGGVTNMVINPDPIKKYTPVCVWSNFNIDGSTGNWSVTFTWRN